MRKTDIVARLGGDEFAILLKNIDRDECERIGRAMLRRVRDRRLPIEGSRTTMTTSLGIALFGEEEPSVENLLVSADLAMYAAKDAGGNRLEFATDDGGTSRACRPGSAGSTRSAGHSTRTASSSTASPSWTCAARGDAVGVAAAHDRRGRGDHPARGLHPDRRAVRSDPGDRPLGRAARDRPAQPAPGRRRGVRVEVNLSGKSMDDPELLSMVERELNVTGADPGDLIFEITETAAIADMERARAFADRLTALGCRFALDDFGSGFSSFYYLKYLPLNYLKIDGDFIRSMTNSPTDQLVVKAMVDIAQGMGMKTIAEFVETPETAACSTPRASTTRRATTTASRARSPRSWRRACPDPVRQPDWTTRSRRPTRRSGRDERARRRDR